MQCSSELNRMAEDKSRALILRRLPLGLEFFFLRLPPDSLCGLCSQPSLGYSHPCIAAGSALKDPQAKQLVFFSDSCEYSFPRLGRYPLPACAACLRSIQSWECQVRFDPIHSRARLATSRERSALTALTRRVEHQRERREPACRPAKI